MRAGQHCDWPLRAEHVYLELVHHFLLCGGRLKADPGTDWRDGKPHRVYCGRCGFFSKPFAVSPAAAVEFNENARWDAF